MTAAALLTVVGVTLIMQQADLPASLGAFIAGALLAESGYRHQLEADIAPFEGLLLGMFFAAVGMSLDLRLLVSSPGLIVCMTIALIAIKASILYALGRLQGLDSGPSRRMAFALAQGGEFAFVLLSVATTNKIFGKAIADLLTVVVTLSMAMTPILLMLERRLFPKSASPASAYDTLPDSDDHVVIAGFGRFGQITARILRAKKIPFTALDINAEQIELVRRFGNTAFYGDATRPEILEAAQIGKARAFVLAIDNVEASMQIAEHVQTRYPHVKIYARARDRAHAYRLLDRGITTLRRETFLSAIDLTQQLLIGLGYSESMARRTVKLFQTHDERRLFDDYKLASDMEKLLERARSDSVRLEKLFQEDVEEEAKAANPVIAGESKAREAKAIN